MFGTNKEYNEITYLEKFLSEFWIDSVKTYIKLLELMHILLESNANIYIYIYMFVIDKCIDIKPI